MGLFTLSFQKEWLKLKRADLQSRGASIYGNALARVRHSSFFFLFLGIIVS
jgi:hypothetical protein